MNITKTPNQIIEEMKYAIDKFTPQVCGVFATRGFPHTEEAVRFLVERWAIAKYDLIQLLSCHPDWDADKFMVMQSADIERPIDTATLSGFMDWCMTKIGYGTDFDASLRTSEETQLYSYFYEGLSTLKSLRSKLLTQDDISNLEFYFTDLFMQNDKLTPKVGQKTSRWVNQLIQSAYPEIVASHKFNSAFARYSDAINPGTIKRRVFFSVNPIDYILSSHGNSWRTCHYIGYFSEHDDINGVSQHVGEYAAGVLSYLCDTSSIVMYTLKDDFAGDRPELQPKITRCMFAYKDYKLLQQRIYPASNDGQERLYQEYANIAITIIAECLGVENIWIGGHVPSFCRAGINALNYQDWREQSSTCSFLNILDAYKDCPHTDSMITVGGKPYDIYYKGELLINYDRLTTV